MTDHLAELALGASLVILFAIGARRAFRVLSGRMRFEAIEGERHRIARELHDTLSQGLTGLGFQIECAVRSLYDNPVASEAHLEQAHALVQSSLSDIRRSIWHLHPGTLEGRSLAAAMAESIRKTTAGTPVRVDFEVIGAPRSLARSMESHLLRMQQEALTNALKHSSARHIRIELIYEPRSVRVRVTDDGLGFDTVTQSLVHEGGFGLEGMRERARQLGGELTIRQPFRGGTEVILEAPVRRKTDLRQRAS